MSEALVKMTAKAIYEHTHAYNAKGTRPQWGQLERFRQFQVEEVANQAINTCRTPIEAALLVDLMDFVDNEGSVPIGILERELQARTGGGS